MGGPANKGSRRRAGTRRWRGRRARRAEGWWRAHDGRWYPPSLARHPAAQGEIIDLRGEAGDQLDDEILDLRDQRDQQGGKQFRGVGSRMRSSRRGPWITWAVLVTPLALLGTLVLGLISAATEPQTVETTTRTETGSAASTTESPTSTSRSSAPSTNPSDRPGGSVTSSTGTPDSPVGSTAVPGSMPASKDDCKNGGWALLVDDEGQRFPNQGQCVAFVNLGG